MPVNNRTMFVENRRAADGKGDYRILPVELVEISGFGSGFEPRSDGKDLFRFADAGVEHKKGNDPDARITHITFMSMTQLRAAYPWHNFEGCEYYSPRAA